MKRFVPPRYIELSPWKTPLGIGRSYEKEVELEADYDDDDTAQIKRNRHKEE